MPVRGAYRARHGEKVEKFGGQTSLGRPAELESTFNSASADASFATGQAYGSAAAWASPNDVFDSHRKMRFHSNQAMVSPRGLQCLQESGHWRPRHVPIMTRPPWLSHWKKRSGNGSRRTAFYGHDDARHGGSRAQHRLDYADLRNFDSADGAERPQLAWGAEAAGLEYPRVRRIWRSGSRLYPTLLRSTQCGERVHEFVRSWARAVRGLHRALSLFFAQQPHRLACRVGVGRG